jgi:hypothetical protein
MVGRKHGLDTVGRLMSRGQAHACVVYQHVQPVMVGFELLHEAADRILRREVGLQQLDLLIAGRRHHALSRCLAALPVSGHHHEVGSHPAEGKRYLLAYPCVCPGDHHDLALHAAGSAVATLHVLLLHDSRGGCAD